MKKLYEESLCFIIKLPNFVTLPILKKKTPSLSQSPVVYTLVCPVCKSCYVGKNDRAWEDKATHVRQG